MSTETAGKTTPARPRRRKGWVDEQSRFFYRLTYLVFQLLFSFWLGPYRSTGQENIPSTGGAFLVGNHTSAMDPFLLGLGVKQRMLRGPGKVELFKNPVVAFLMRKLGIIPLHRLGIDAAAIRTMVELYRAGKVVTIFPEGGRSKTGELGPFEPGFARLALKLKARLVPAGIAGAGDILPIGSLIPRRGNPVAVAFGSAFDLSAFYDRELTTETVNEANAFMRQKVAAQLEAARQERSKLLNRA